MRGLRDHYRLTVGADASRHLPFMLPARQSRASERKPAFEESPDTEEQGGWVTDPGKPAGKCHRNKPPKRRGPLPEAAGLAGCAGILYPAAGKGEKVR